ncbi:MAG TPA: tetratricopeptide repeat protein [Roseiflexaceae bacterium]|nr:tetratricopeptide repeat protein [Roseiflexaceae bacterium]
MTKQDEKLRLRRRLQDQAVDQAAKNRWEEAVETNLQLINLGEDADTHNRLGKAYFELGKLAEARESYQRALRLNSNNAIARKNVERLEDLLSRTATAPIRTTRQLVDLRLFITETGKTALTTLVDVARGPLVDAVVTGEKVDLRLEGRHVLVIDASGNTIGRIEPKLAQRLSELMTGGNRYAAAVAQTNGHQLRVLIREVYQDPSQRGRVSFPGKLGESALRGGYFASARYDEYGEDLMEDEDAIDGREEVEEESFGGEEEELGLDDIEQDIGEEEDMNEE